MNKAIEKLKFNDKMCGLMFSQHTDGITNISKAYEISEEETKELIKKYLQESEMNTGSCVTAFNYLINSCEEGKVAKSLKKGIQENILYAAMTYANVYGKDPKEKLEVEF